MSAGKTQSQQGTTQPIEAQATAVTESKPEERPVQVEKPAVASADAISLLRLRRKTQVVFSPLIVIG